MKTVARVIVATIVTSAALAQTVDFENFKTGALLPGWTGTKTGSEVDNRER